MEFEGRTKLVLKDNTVMKYADLVVKCTAKTAQKIMDEIRNFILGAGVSNAWCFDEVSTAEIGRDVSDPYACFLHKDATGTVEALLALAYSPAGEWHDEGRLWVANVVPSQSGRLSPCEYNAIVQHFADELLNPILVQKFPQLSCEISQTECETEPDGMEEDDEDKADVGRFADFKIGTAPTGEPIRYTCNPKCLSNFFGLNPGAPQYLTPVFFKTAVLDRYRDEPSCYAVESGCLRCRRKGITVWTLPMGNDDIRCVCAWLGDLGMIPYSQQQHFASYNVTRGEIDAAFFKTQICAEFCDVRHPVAVFKNAYFNLRSVGWETLGWHVLLPLAAGDSHYFSSLKLLTHDEQKEFDEQILALTKILIDSLNIQELRKLVPCEKLGITLLENVFQQRGAVGSEGHIQFLRELQRMRSKSVAHRKSRDEYATICRDVGMDRLGPGEVLRRFFEKGTSFLQFVQENIDIFK